MAWNDWERLNKLETKLRELNGEMHKFPIDSEEWRKLNEQYLDIEFETELLKGYP